MSGGKSLFENRNPTIYRYEPGPLSVDSGSNIASEYLQKMQPYKDTGVRLVKKLSKVIRAEPSIQLESEV